MKKEKIIELKFKKKEENQKRKMIEEFPLTSINVKIMKIFSFIIKKNWKRFFIVFLVTIYCTGQFGFVIFGTEIIEIKIQHACGAVIVFNAITRGYVLLFYSEKIENTLNNLEKDYYEDMVKLK